MESITLGRDLAAEPGTVSGSPINGRRNSSHRSGSETAARVPRKARADGLVNSLPNRGFCNGAGGFERLGDSNASETLGCNFEACIAQRDIIEAACPVEARVYIRLDPAAHESFQRNLLVPTALIEKRYRRLCIRAGKCTSGFTREQGLEVVVRKHFDKLSRGSRVLGSPVFNCFGGVPSGPTYLQKRGGVGSRLAPYDACEVLC
jgi:hypothetical protein